MKEESKKLLFISIVAFITFLIAFGKAFYEYGYNASLEGLALAFIFPIFYFIMTAVAIVFNHNAVITKRPYIIMAILSSAFMAVIWIIYCCSGLAEDSKVPFTTELWYPIVLSVLSLIMSICYIIIVVNIIKLDKKIESNNQSNKE